MSVRGGIGAVIGGTIGFLAGGPTGAYYGAQIGYSVGASTESGPGTTVEGPRLGDLTVQTSQYGAPLPILYGTTRLAGNLIWVENDQLIERRVVQEEGGKGGGSSQKTITYHYYGSFAVALCEGPIQGVRRIWADSKLIYDVGENASIGTVIASNQKGRGIRVYTGTTTQNPDPDIEADRTNAPAYRGTAYIVFDYLPLKAYGNRIPNITAEVVDGTNAMRSLGDMTIREDVADFQQSCMIHMSDNNTLYFAEASWDNNKVGADVTIHLVHANGMIETGYTFQTAANNEPIVGNSDIPICGFPSSTTNRQIFFYKIDEDGGFVSPWGTIAYDHNSGNRTDLITCIKYGEYLFLYHKYNHTTATANTLYRNDWDALVYTTVAQQGTAPIPLIDDTTSTSQVATWYEICIADDTIYVLCDDDTVATYTLDGALIKSFTLSPSPSPAFNYSHVPGAAQQRLVAGNNGRFFIFDQQHPQKFYEVDTVAETLTFIGSPGGTALSNFYFSHHFRNGILYECGNLLGRPTDYFARRFAVTSIGDGTTTLSSIVSDLFDRSGLDSAEYDVTALTDEVRGFVHTRPAPASSDILHLQRAFYFDVIESDYKLKCVKRGGAVAATVTDADLSAHEAGQDRPQVLVENRKLETELPLKVRVDFIDPNREYDPSEQYAERLITGSKHIETVNLPVVLTVAEGAQIAESLLYDSWLSRNTYEFSLPWKFSHLDPGDILTLSLDIGTFTVRLISVDYGKPGLVTCKAVAEEVSIYSPVTVAEQGGTVTEAIEFIGDTRWKFLDIPILRDQDNDPGYYFCGASPIGSWPGAVLFRSTDNGLTYEEIDRAGTAATMGLCTTALPNGPTTVIDESSTVTVRLYADATLSSVTEDAMRSGSNLCAIGADGRWEILKFQNATLNADGSYTLDTLIRGYRGTGHNTGNHTASDSFILLTASTVFRHDPGSDFIGTQYTYKAVTSGSNLSQTTSTTFSNDAVGLKPFAPVHIHATRDASQNATIRWTRQGRLGGAMRDYVDLPQDEASESYEIDIISQGSPDEVLRTLTSTTNSVSYTAAQQTTDFGSAQTAILVRVYQMSATVGRGYQGEATV